LQLQGVNSLHLLTRLLEQKRRPTLYFFPPAPAPVRPCDLQGTKPEVEKMPPKSAQRSPVQAGPGQSAQRLPGELWLPGWRVGSLRARARSAAECMVRGLRTRQSGACSATCSAACDSHKLRDAAFPTVARVAKRGVSLCEVKMVAKRGVSRCETLSGVFTFNWLRNAAVHFQVGRRFTLRNAAFHFAKRGVSQNAAFRKLRSFFLRNLAFSRRFVQNVLIPPFRSS